MAKYSRLPELYPSLQSQVCRRHLEVKIYYLVCPDVVASVALIVVVVVADIVLYSKLQLFS